MNMAQEKTDHDADESHIASPSFAVLFSPQGSSCSLKLSSGEGKFIFIFKIAINIIGEHAVSIYLFSR